MPPAALLALDAARGHCCNPVVISFIWPAYLELAHEDCKEGLQPLLVHHAVAGGGAAAGGKVEALEGAGAGGALALQDQQQQLHACEGGAAVAKRGLVAGGAG